MRQHEKCTSRLAGPVRRQARLLARPELGAPCSGLVRTALPREVARPSPSKANGLGAVNPEAGAEPGKTAKNDLLYRFFESDFFDASIALT